MEINKIFFICILLYDFINTNSTESKYISIPFVVKSINPNPNYNSSNFLNDFYIKQIILELNIGTPPQKVNGLLDQAEECFKFVTNDYDKYFINETYYPNLSSSFQNIGSTLAKDYISVDKNKESYFLSFSIEKYNINSNLSYIPKIGLNIPTLFPINTCPNLIAFFKKENLIKELMWTIEYTNENGGNFVFGDDLTNYDEIKYPKSNYYQMYLRLKYFINFDEVYISENSLENNNKININKTDSMLNINYGVIIGPNEYKNQIDKIYFKELIDKGICNVDRVNYTFNGKKNMEYYIYSCNENSFANKKNNYYNKFPSLIFSSKSIEYNFEFTNKDLFVKINNKFYFLIIFQTLIKPGDIIWYLGEPFYKKYTFSLQFDSKAIGFYLNKSKGIDNNNGLDDNNFKAKYIIIIIIGVLALIILIIATILVLIYLKERKKRMNELEDDNYEYVNDTSINDPKQQKKLINN